jgi:transcriptional regulator with XRE-family HTH domain
MGWNGEQIRIRAKELGTSFTELAQSLKVSRVSLNNWAKGQSPKGSHLVALCRALGVGPDYFFTPEQLPVTVPMHRTRRRARVTKQMQEAAYELVAGYVNLFRKAPDPGLVPVLRIEERTEQNALKMALQFREMSGVQESQPIDYKHAFDLLDKLGIVVIFRTLPKEIKGYAFYCTINRHRVVFVDTATHLLDLIFPLLHEAVHALRDERGTTYDDEEEKFCDMVANFIQFPDGYVAQVARMLNGKQDAQRIALLRRISEERHHSLFGIAKRLEAYGIRLPTKAVGGADTNLKKHMNRTVGKVLFRSDDAVSYIEILSELSPRFITILSKSLSSCTDRKFGEWIDLDNQIDSSMARQALESKLALA